MSSVFKACFDLELRKQLTYRSDFWINFGLNAFGRLVIAYYLWVAVFAASAKPEIGGLTFHQTLSYFFISLFVDMIVRSSSQRLGLVAQEIYDGSLSRYLVYPTQFLDFKTSRILVYAVVGLIQMSLGYLALWVLFGSQLQLFALQPVLMGLISLVPGLVLYFLAAFALEMIAFWAEGVWSLNVILRFASGFLGGSFLPISMFPEAWQKVLYLLPFYGMVGMPTEAFMGRKSWEQVWSNGQISLIWIALFAGLSHLIWRKGIRKFSGVGM